MLKNLINKIYDSIVENINFLFNNNNFKIEKEGEIFIGRTAPITIFEIEKMTKTILLLIKKIEKKSYKTFQKKSETVDEFKINMVILITFDTVEGYRAIEKSLIRTEFEINKQNYKETEILINKRLVLLFEEYNIISIDEFIVKMF